MIKIGKVRNVLPIQKDWIISIDLDDVDVPISNGDLLWVETSGEIEVSGLKFWPERRAVDILVKGCRAVPVPGQSVYTSK